MKVKMNRREFIKKSSSAVVGAGIALNSKRYINAEPVKSRVVEVMHSGAVKDKRKVDVQAVKEMIRIGIETLTGSKNPWKQFIKPEDRVGLKINTLGRPMLYTHHELIQAVAEELLDIGVKEKNIIIWDRFEGHMKNSNFTFNNTGVGVQCYGTNSREKRVRRNDLNVFYKSSFDDPGKRDNNGTISPFSKIFTQDCNKIINMAILKDHGLSGVTLCLKNLAFGVCNNNSRFHGKEHIGLFISEFCAMPQIKEKVVLHIIDGLEACFDKGPVPSSPNVLYAPKTLWLGTDPVALDAVGFQVIDAKRKDEGLPPLSQTGRPVDHIKLAAQKGVGIDDLSKIKIDKIKLG